jgi:hypothetical protein
MLRTEGLPRKSILIFVSSRLFSPAFLLSCLVAPDRSLHYVINHGWELVALGGAAQGSVKPMRDNSPLNKLLVNI